MNQYINELIARLKKEYKENPDRMISDYNREKDLIKEYNGRQLLELLQNADDAESTEILIRLNKINKTLTIANQGKPFTREGVKSLMISNLSPKIQKKYIGNKGLGFRSVINWADEININSNGIDIRFSKNIANSTFDNLFDKEKKLEILSERGLSEGTKPIAYLSIPTTISSHNSTWTTTIEIKYKSEVENDIEKQIFKLQDEVLLFLNYINKIHIEGTTDDKTISRIIDNNKISINNKTWTIYRNDSKNSALPDHLQDKDTQEKEHYDLKVAIRENLDDDIYKLFCFFPTKIDIHFPMVIHGTFDLDNSRNQLVNSEKNKYVLNKLVDLIAETALKISEEEVTWKPLKLLTCLDNSNTILEELEFFVSIMNESKTLEIFPCVDNSYRKLDDTVFISNAFSEFIQNTQNTDLFPNHLKSFDDEDVVVGQYEPFHTLDPKELNEKINALSKRLRTVDHRIELIYIVEQLPQSQANLYYGLLTNDKGEIISESNDAYTPKSQDAKDFLIPHFVNLDFIGIELYNKLVSKYDITGREIARNLQRKLKSIVKIQSYEPAPVLSKIVTATNRIIEEDPQNKSSYLKQMFRSLFSNFKVIDDNTNIPETTKVKILSKDHQLVDAKDLYLSSDYLSGELTEILFDGIYSDSNYIASRRDLGLEEYDIEIVEDFLLWLGVNKHCKINERPLGGHDKEKYTEYVFQHIARPETLVESQITIYEIDAFIEIIEKLHNQKEKVITWIIKDVKLFDQFQNRNKDDFKYRKKSEQSYKHSFQEKPSYILYQFFQAGIFTDYILTDDHNISFINPFDFDFEHHLFQKYNISRTEIESIMLKLGATRNFSDISIDRLSSIINQLENTNPNGNQTQKIYKLALDHYRKHKCPLIGEIRIFSKKGKQKDYFSYSEVYYSDNIVLPQKTMEKYPVIDIPRRVGETQVCNFFKVKNLNDINITLVDEKQDLVLTNKFQNFFNQIKAYILAYRISQLKVKRDKSSDASILNKLKFILCHSILCNIGDDTQVSLDSNDHIIMQDTCYIAIKQNSTISTLRKDSDFCDAFVGALIIAFKVNEPKNDFRKILRDDINDTEHIIRNELGEDVITEARELLGMSDYRYSFWSAIYKSIKKDFTQIPQDVSFFETIKMDLGLDCAIIESIDYEYLSDETNFDFLRSLFMKLSITIQEFNKHAYYPIDFITLHQKKLRFRFHDCLKKFKYSLWKHLNDKITQQPMFLSIVNQYEKCEDYIDNSTSKCSYLFDANYTEMVNEFIETKFPYISMTDKINDEEINLIKRQNQKIIGENIFANNLPIEIESLLYFKNNIEKVKEFLELQYKDEGEVSPIAPSLLNLIEASMSKPIQTPDDSKKVKKPPYKYNPYDDHVKRKRGRASEKKVYDKLVEIYGLGNVEWVSSNSSVSPIMDDSKHYDMRYSPNGIVWKYVEVKTLSNDIFYLSKSEKLFGEENKDDYELFLVHDNNIYVIKNFFDFDGIHDFYNNPKYNVEDTEYIIKFRLSEKELDRNNS